LFQLVFKFVSFSFMNIFYIFISIFYSFLLIFKLSITNIEYSYRVLY